MSKKDLLDLEWKFATGQLSYEDYREAVKGLWGKANINTNTQRDCTLQFNPEPGIAVRTTLIGDGGGRGR